ncbi:unnamed protein product, partial [Darwinula stevensoni]
LKVRGGGESPLLVALVRAEGTRLPRLQVQAVRQVRLHEWRSRLRAEPRGPGPTGEQSLPQSHDLPPPPRSRRHQRWGMFGGGRGGGRRLAGRAWWMALPPVRHLESRGSTSGARRDHSAVVYRLHGLSASAWTRLLLPHGSVLPLREAGGVVRVRLLHLQAPAVRRVPCFRGTGAAKMRIRGPLRYSISWNCFSFSTL